MNFLRFENGMHLSRFEGSLERSDERLRGKRGAGHYEEFGGELIRLGSFFVVEL
jgi:hypothetical protein